MGKCVYSIKKFLAYVFTVLAIYIAIAATTLVFAGKEITGLVSLYGLTLTFIAALLGLREYAKKRFNRNQDEEL